MRRFRLITQCFLALYTLAFLSACAEQPETVCDVPEIVENAVETVGSDDVVAGPVEPEIGSEATPGDVGPAAAYEEGQAGEADGISLESLTATDASEADLSDLSFDPVDEMSDVEIIPYGSGEYGSDGIEVEMPPELQDQDLFAGYLSRLFYGSASGIPMATTRLGDGLTARQRGVYDILKSMVLEIAEGNRSDTVINIPVSMLLDRTQFTLPAEHVWDWCKQLQADMDAVIGAIYSDCEYELYWVSSIQYFYPESDMQYDGGTGCYSVSIADTLPCQFYVGREFAIDRVTVDTSHVQYAYRAMKNAKSIVQKYADYSDYAKLYAYAMTICELVDYNYDALEPDWDPNNYNPYRLLWVFDGDPSTQVVCAGYTAAYQYLCELTDFDSGVRSYAVSGLTEGSDAGHAWNIIRMDDGKNYVVDVTWMDNGDKAQKPANLVSRINGQDTYYGRSDSWFLVGAQSGSVAGGYNIDFWGEQNEPKSFRSYYDDVRTQYDASILTLSQKSYLPTGFMRIGGKTYYFGANGHFVTGKQKIGNTYYEFGKDGALTGAWAEGWQTINGKRYYFDAKGLHRDHTLVRDAAIPATCTRKGKTEGSHCSVCGLVVKAQEVVPAFGHVPMTDAGYEATCTHPGKTDGSHCQLCGEVFKNQEVIPQKEHTLAYTGGIEPTCTSNGWTDYVYCAVCNELLKDTEYIPPTGHNVVVDAGYPATCTAQGITEGSHCANCGEVFQAQEVIPAAGHSPVIDAGVAPAYKVPGVTEGSHCAVCGAVLVAQQPIPALTYQELALSKAKNNGTVTLNVGEQRLIVPAFATASGWTVNGYKSSKPAVASIDGNGLLTANAEGKTKITVTTANKKKATVTVKVVNPYKPLGIAIAQGKSITIKVGESVQLGVGLNPTTAQSALTWKTNKAKIATVDANGVVTAVKKGKAKITVSTYNKKKATITVNVVP